MEIRAEGAELLDLRVVVEVAGEVDLLLFLRGRLLAALGLLRGLRIKLRVRDGLEIGLLFVLLFVDVDVDVELDVELLLHLVLAASILAGLLAEALGDAAPAGIGILLLAALRLGRLCGGRPRGAGLADEEAVDRDDDLEGPLDVHAGLIHMLGMQEEAARLGHAAIAGEGHHDEARVHGQLVAVVLLDEVSELLHLEAAVLAWLGEDARGRRVALQGEAPTLDGLRAAGEGILGGFEGLARVLVLPATEASEGARRAGLELDGLISTNVGGCDRQFDLRSGGGSTRDADPYTKALGEAR